MEIEFKFKPMTTLIDFINKTHLNQFSIAILAMIFYFVTFQNGHPSELFQTIAIAAVAFFFANVTTSATGKENGLKLDQINSKLDTQEILKAKSQNKS